MYFAYGLKFGKEIKPTICKEVPFKGTIDILSLIYDKDFALSDGLLIFEAQEKDELKEKITFCIYTRTILKTFPLMDHKDFLSLDNQTVLVKL